MKRFRRNPRSAQRGEVSVDAIAAAAQRPSPGLIVLPDSFLSSRPALVATLVASEEGGLDVRAVGCSRR